MCRPVAMKVRIPFWRSASNALRAEAGTELVLWDKRVPSTSKKMAVIYARYATERAIDGKYDEQYKQCIKHIEASGYELAGVYTDERASGLRTDHPAINELRTNAAAGKFDIVVVFDYSRISRDASAARDFLDEMQRLNVAVESVDGLKGASALCQLKRIK